MLSVSTDRLIVALEGRGITLSWGVQQAMTAGWLANAEEQEVTMADARGMVAFPDGHDGDIACELWALISAREAADCERHVNSRYRWLSGPDNHHTFLMGLALQNTNDYNANIRRFRSDGISNRRIDW